MYLHSAFLSERVNALNVTDKNSDCLVVICNIRCNNKIFFVKYKFLNFFSALFTFSHISSFISPSNSITS